MDSALRQPLTPAPRAGLALVGLAWLGLVGGALLGVWALWSVLLSATPWQHLWAHPQWPRAVQHTLVSASLGTCGGAALGVWVLRMAWGGPHWRLWTWGLPAWLALPHVAFAAAGVWLLAPSGWLARLGAGWLWPAQQPPDWWWPQDPYGLSLGLGLALKEAVFFIWMGHAHLSQARLQTPWLAAQALGLHGAMAWRWVLAPPLWRAMRGPLLAMWAYSLSVVDMATVLGPTTPPTLAVLAHQWLLDPQTQAHALGAAATWVISLMMVLGAGVGGYWTHRLTRPKGWPAGVTWPAKPAPVWVRWAQGVCAPSALGLWWGSALAGWGVLGMAAGARGWLFPDLWHTKWQGPDFGGALAWAAWNSIHLSLASASLGTALAMLSLACVRGPWLAWGQAALVLPALPLAAGQHWAWVQLGWDGTWWAVVLSHTLWVWPYALLVLSGPYQQLPRGLALSAQAMGLGPWRTHLQVVWPLLARHVATAWAVGVSVSVAQYLPTLYSGAGRWPTLTTEAVTAAAGGQPQAMAAYALLQSAWPGTVFAALALVWLWARRRRQGWM